MQRKFDIIVIGGGHAGSEAAHACAKLGLNTLLLTNNIDQIASMPCNPAIGGPAKSHLVKEIDALGGLMGLAADATYMQLKTLNTSKGPAVRALRAQSDKKEYSAWVRQYLENLSKLTIYQSSAKALLFATSRVNSNFTNDFSEFDLHSESSLQILEQRVIGVQTNLDEEIFADAVVLTAGTFLEGRIFTGDKFQSAGRAGEQASLGLSQSVKNFGLRTGRLKTGTPPRLDRNTIDFSALEIAEGNASKGVYEFFSFLPNRPIRREYPCHITRTNAKTHEIILQNLHKSPMYSGLVEGVGPRYCPSIEDKVVRFSHNPSHHFFLEPEGIHTKEIYLQGCSTSLPIDVQWQIVRSLPGCEKAEITRPAYAVEYDYFPGIQFKHNLEAKNISGLFVAGQVLGTSGYEEAAAQGIMAGLNAAVYVTRNAVLGSNIVILDSIENTEKNHCLLGFARHNEMFVLERSSSYIGTLIDDLVTKEITDPYRMLTSRSEYRLVLRQDNADQRLTPIGRKIGLVDDYRWSCFEEKQERLEKEIKYFSSVKIDANKFVMAFTQKTQEQKEFNNDPNMNSWKNFDNKILLSDLLKRPEVSYQRLKSFIHLGLEQEDIEKLKKNNLFIEDVRYGFELETFVKYEGYVNRQMVQIKEMEKYESIKIPEDFDFKNCNQISLEARDKLARVQPKTLGQAGRVGGVTPNDVSVLSVLIESRRRQVKVSTM